MDTTWKAIIWQQFGAAIDMLENALLACPEELWSDRSQRAEAFTATGARFHYGTLICPHP